MKINQYEYGYLKGDEVMWPGWGAAFAVTQEFCNGQGLGSFGKPTESGLKAMKDYEEQDKS